MADSTQLAVVISLKDELSGKMTGINNSLSKMGTVGNNLKSTFSGIGNRFGTEFNLIGKMAKTATAGVGLLAGGVVGLGVASVKAAADVETMKVALKTAMGGDASAAGKAFDTISKFAAKTPYQMDEVMRSFIKLKNMGLDPSEKALTSYGDTASAMGKGLNDMIEAVADAATGEFERLKEFGIRSSSEGDRVKFTFKGVTTEVGKNSKEIEQYLIKLGETNFTGGMEQQSQTLSGLLSTMKDNFSITMSTFATESGLLDVAKNAVQGLSTFVEQNKDTFVRWGREAIDVIRTKIKEWVEQMGGPEGIKQKMEEFKDKLLNEVIPAIMHFIKIIGDVIKFVWDHREAILWAIIAWEAFKVAISAWEIFSAVKMAIMGITSVISGAGGLSAAFSSLAAFLMNPWTIAIAVAIAAIVACVIQFNKLQDQLEENRKWLDNNAKSLDILQGKVGSLKTDSANKQLQDAINKSRDADKALKDLTERYEGLGGVLNAVGDQFYDWGQKASKAIEKVWGKMKDFAKEAGTSISKAWDEMFASGGIVQGYANGGVVYAAGGFFKPKGTDTVPAMLTPGEMVLNAGQQANLFNQLNTGKGRSVTINITGDNYFSNEADEDRLIDKIKQEFSREQERAAWGIS